MTGAQIDATGFLAGLAGVRKSLGRLCGGAVTDAAKLGQTIVRANASSGTHPPGRPHVGGPGPNVATGAYRRSIAVNVGRSASVIVADLSTDAVQGPRLEYGFIGRDALGRYYRQPPYPHFEPAVPQIEAFAEKAADDAASTIAGRLGGTGA